jgi:hypothetical protein
LQIINDLRGQIAALAEQRDDAHVDNEGLVIDIVHAESLLADREGQIKAFLLHIDAAIKRGTPSQQLAPELAASAKGFFES